MNNIIITLNNIIYNFYKRDDGQYICLITAFNDIDEVIDEYSVYYDTFTEYQETMIDLINLVEA